MQTSPTKTKIEIATRDEAFKGKERFFHTLMFPKIKEANVKNVVFKKSNHVKITIDLQYKPAGP